MSTDRRIVVAVGPTISAANVHAVLPNAEVVPPIKFGDSFAYGLRSKDTLLIVDGLFFQNEAVRHKELLTLISQGIRVVGASSMGALRAAELHQFGMEGYGWVFEAYRDGILDADDEVGMVHGAAEDGYPVFVDALVNIRHTVQSAVHAGLLSTTLAADIIASACRTTFTLRGWDRLLAAAGAPDRHGLARQLRDMRVDIKHADALAALRHIDRGTRDRPVRPAPPPTMWSQRWQQRWAPPALVTPSSAHGSVIEVSDLDLLSMLSVCSIDRWAYVPALEQVAAWHWTLKHPEQPGTVRDRARLAIAEAPCDTELRALETVAHRYAQATGVIDESGFTADIRSHWLTPEENRLLCHDPVAASARVITRTLFATPSLPAVEHFLDLLRADNRVAQWRHMAASALSMRDDLARQQPHLNLRRPKLVQLKRLYAARWGTPVDHIELPRRGMMTERCFYDAATLFAVAAADDRLPAIEVGTLGPERSGTVVGSPSAYIGSNLPDQS